VLESFLSATNEEDIHKALTATMENKK